MACGQRGGLGGLVSGYDAENDPGAGNGFGRGGTGDQPGLFDPCLHRGGDSRVWVGQLDIKDAGAGITAGCGHCRPGLAKADQRNL